MPLVLAACATRQLKMDFATFSDAYAANMNWQMLLNLARLDQGHPAYFMAIGEIRLARTQSGTTQLGGTTSNTDQNVDAFNAGTLVRNLTATATDAITGNFSGNAANSANPTFVFIPINSEEAARQLLAPVPVDVFNTLYQQGWPVDQLMRVLVERIEVEIDTEQGSRRIVVTNSPTRASPASFARFLRVCDFVRELQKNGGLSLAIDEKFVPLGTGELPVVLAKDMTDAADKGRVFQKDEHGWRLGSMRQSYHFRARGDLLERTVNEFENDPAFQVDDSLKNLEIVFGSNLSVGGAGIERDGETRGGPRSVLVLRSYRNVLEAVAQEQRAFDELMRDPTFAAQVPTRQRRPILRTDWSDQPKTEFVPALVSLSYGKKSYQITDPEGSAASLESRWNRDVFRLLVNLSSQVTVDITKFQRQVLELNQ
jgi:hypothetical protein